MTDEEPEEETEEEEGSIYNPYSDAKANFLEAGVDEVEGLGKTGVVIHTGMERHVVDKAVYLDVQQPLVIGLVAIDVFNSVSNPEVLSEIEDMPPEVGRNDYVMFAKVIIPFERVEDVTVELSDDIVYAGYGGMSYSGLRAEKEAGPR